MPSLNSRRWPPGRGPARRSIRSRSIRREQYFTAIDRIEDKLGLSGQARAVVFHVKGGREHCHVVWSRIDTDQMKAVQLSHDRQKLRVIARELGQEFGHDLPHGLRTDRGGERFGADGATSAAELAQAERSGLTADERRKEITSAYREATSAQGFIDGLWQRGYHLAKGDQRGFVVVDQGGQVHSLSRQIVGASAKDLRAMLAPLTPDDLPSVKETRKRIADQLDSEALDERQEPHLRRAPEELKARQAERRAELEALWQKAELAQRDERIQLHVAQKKERERPFARATMTVFGLLGRVPVLRSVLGPLYKNPALNIEERHRLENEALDRRYQRERKTLDRRLSALDRVEARENKSLARDQRRLDAGLERKRGRAADAFQRASSAETPPDYDKAKGQEAKQERKQAPRKNRPRGYRFEP